MGSPPPSYGVEAIHHLSIIDEGVSIADDDEGDAAYVSLAWERAKALWDGRRPRGKAYIWIGGEERDPLHRIMTKKFRHF